MRKIIFAINVTIDGFADHTAMIADNELHDFFAGFLKKIDVVLYGRKTYELMADFWPTAEKDPVSTKSMKDFAVEINSVSKIVFSKTLTNVKWMNTKLAQRNLIEEISGLKKQDGNNIAVGSLSLASQLADYIDEFWFAVHPVILGEGTRLFPGLSEKYNLKLIDSKTLNSGVTVLHYIKS